MQGGTVQTKKANPEQVLECQVKENEEIIKGVPNTSIQQIRFWKFTNTYKHKIRNTRTAWTKNWE